MPTLTEDAFRRRELAALGVQAEVDTDGHNAVVRLSIHALDDLIASIETDDDRERRHQASYEAGDTHGWGEGFSEGFDAGREDMAKDIGKLADLTPEQLASLAPQPADLPDLTAVRPS